MAKICSPEFLDENGNRSSFYYDNLHLGHEAALDIYIKNMQKHTRVKFHKSSVSGNKSTVDKLNILSSKFDDSLDRVTNKIVNNSKEEFDEVSIIENRLDYGQMVKIIEENPELYGLTKNDLKMGTQKIKFSLNTIKAKLSRGEKLEGQELAYTKMLEWKGDLANQKEIEETRDNIKRKFNFLRDAGTNIHFLLLEAYARVYDSNKEIDTLIEEALSYSKPSGKINEFYNNNQESINKLFVEFHKKLDEITKKGKYQLMTEVKIADSEMGIRGIVDMIVIDDNGNAKIYDIKTKEIDKENVFDAKYQLRKEPVSDLYANAKTDAELQTSAYRMILHKNGIKVIGAEVLYLSGEIIDKKTSSGKRKLVYKSGSFKFGKNVLLSYHKTEVMKLLGKKITSRKIEPGKINTSSDLMQLISGHDDYTNYKNIDLLIKRQLAEKPSSDEKGEYFMAYKEGKVNREKEYFKPTKEEREKQLRASYEIKSKRHSKLSKDIISFFKNNKEGRFNNSDYQTEKVNNLLAGIDKDNYTLESVQSIDGFEDAPFNFLIAKNKNNGAARIIFATGLEYGSFLPVPKDKNEKRTKETSLFSNFISDKEIKRLYNRADVLQATRENYALLQAGILAMELKNAGEITGVEELVFSSVNDKNANDGGIFSPIKVKMGDMLPHIKILKDIFESGKVEEEMSNDLSLVLNDKKLNESKTYQADYVLALESILREHSKIFKLSEKDRLDLVNKIDSYKLDKRKQRELLNTLIGRFRIMTSSLSAKGQGYEELSKIKEYKAVYQAILQLSGFYLENTVLKDNINISDRYTTINRTNNEGLKFLNTKIEAAEQKISAKMQKFRAENRRLIDALKDKKGSLGFTNITGNDLFFSMFKVDPRKMSDEDLVKSNLGDLFTLKDPSQVDTKEEADYIRFFNKTIIEIFELSLEATNRTKDLERLRKGELWPEGRVPLMFATSIQKIANAQGLKDTFSELVSGFKRSGIKNTKKDFNALNTTLNNDFLAQLNSENYRYDMLGLDLDGNKVANTEELEMNLDAILTHFMEDNLRTAYFEETLALYNALNAAAFMEQSENFRPTEKTRALVADLIKLKVYGEYRDEGKIGESADMLKKSTSVIQFALSPAQGLLELSQNTFMSMGAILQQQLMFSNKRFNMNDFRKAFFIVLGDRLKGVTSEDMTKAEALNLHYGIYNSDSEAQAKIEKIETRKNGIYQSKWLHILAAEPIRFFKLTGVLAEMIHSGSWDAMEVNDQGYLIYNKLKDKRFNGIFNEDGSLKDSNELNDKLKEVKARYNLLLDSLAADGLIDENGEPLQAYSHREISEIKDYSLAVYGSQDKDAKVLMTMSAVGRQLQTFKSWFFAKKDNYWKRPSPSYIKHDVKFKEDENGEIEAYYVPVMAEGIFQTFGFLGMGIIESVKAFDASIIKNKALNLNSVQKENLAKLSSDLIMIAFLTTLLSFLFDDEMFKKGEGKAISKIMNNAINDLNIFSTSTDMLSNSPLAGISAMLRTLEYLSDSLVHALNSEGAESLDKFLRVSGLGRSIKPFTE
jgi:hypothetical protein